MNFEKCKDPFAIFNEWLKEAQEAEINDHNAASLATVDSEGMPNVRIVLLKDFDERGFVFYTNFNSAKGQETLASGKVALGFHWKSKRRQVRVRGSVEQVTNKEADAYFASRHPRSRLGAWASQQSSPLESRQLLLDKLQVYEDKFGTENIPRPPHWNGFRIAPDSIEFWQDGEFRLHDRIQFFRVKNNWKTVRLYP